MTPESLKAWRLRMEWHKKRAALELDLSLNGYAAYESEKRVHRIPRHIALACAALIEGISPVE